MKANAVLGSCLADVRREPRHRAGQVEESVSVRPAVAYRTHLTLGRVDGASADVPLTRDMYSERRTVEAAVSTLPLVWGQGLTAYLENYEYSCTEQLVSKGLGGLILTARPEFGTIRSRDDQPLESTFSVLRARQNEQGGFGLWSSSPATAEFPTRLRRARAGGGQRKRAAHSGGGAVGPERLAHAVRRDSGEHAGGRTAARLCGVPAGAAGHQAGRRDLKRRAGADEPLPADVADGSRGRVSGGDLPVDAANQRCRSHRQASCRGRRQKRDLGDETSTTIRSCTTRSCCICWRGISRSVSAQAPPAALETMARRQRQTATSLSAAYTLLALDAFATATAGTVNLGITEISQGRARASADAAGGAMPKVSIPETAASVQFSKDGPVRAYYVVTESGFDRNPPTAEVSQGVEIMREFLDAKGSPSPA